MTKREAMQFELCAETLAACMAANAGGAQRIELCVSLEVGGLTPPAWLVSAAVRASAIPVHVLLRPHADDFFASAAVVAELEASLRMVRELGAAGAVFGLLLADRRVDVERTRALVKLAGPLEVTFHRAFDDTPDVFAALEDVIAAGCGRVLTSGGAADVVQGATVLKRLVEQAVGRIEVAMGGGLRLENAAAVARVTGARNFHGSLRGDGSGPDAEMVRTMVRVLADAGSGC